MRIYRTLIGFFFTDLARLQSVITEVASDAKKLQFWHHIRMMTSQIQSGPDTWRKKNSPDRPDLAKLAKNSIYCVLTDIIGLGGGCPVAVGNPHPIYVSYIFLCGYIRCKTLPRCKFLNSTVICAINPWMNRLYHPRKALVTCRPGKKLEAREPA